MIIYLPFNMGKISGITLWPFIFIAKRSRGNTVLINHEKIHIQQANELFVVGFYYLYIKDYLKYRIKEKKTHWEAYQSIYFEKEAYTYEDNFVYLSKRPKYNWKQFKTGIITGY